jgi:TonB family protein
VRPLALAGGAPDNRQMRPILRSLAACCLAALLTGVPGPAAHADEAAPSLPEVKIPWPALYYPDTARQANQQGRVLVEFEISPQGRVLEPIVSSAEPQGVFDSTALAYVRELVFDVPDDWEALGDSHYKFYFGFVFRLRPCQAPHCSELIPFPADRSLTVTGKALGAGPAH